MRPPVMVALDGSEKDGRAIAVASAIGKLSESELHFVQVSWDPPRDFVGLPAWAGQIGTTQVLHAPDVAVALIEHAVQRDALLIVLATRAARAGSRAIAGSVADQVMRDSPRPVVLVPPGADFMAGKSPTITRVLIPMDDSSLSLRALELIIELPHAAGLEYVLVEVIEERLRAAADTRLTNTAAWLRSRGARAVETRVIHAPEPAAAIVASVREFLPDAIVMSTRGAGGLGRMLLGSVAEGVVRRSELPVMLLTPRMLAAATP